MTKDSWQSERSRRAATTRKARYGPNVFKEIGAKGGKHSKKKGANDLSNITPYEPLASENNQEREKL